MAISCIKKADKTSATGEDNTRKIVINILKDIEDGGVVK